MNAETHNAKVLAHLQSGKSITPIEALDEFGCFRLGARIYDLKQAGHTIQKQMIEVETREGGTARVAEYFIDELNQ